tara:strand:+ start:12378 stop:12752 length:375 start_codon:yes stop_codon:yes gene_type:complete
MKVYIVLGHKLNKNNEITNRLKKRLDKFIEEYDNKSLVILSGGKNKSKVSEAVKMKEYLLKKSIHIKNLLLETKSVDTFENIINAFTLLKKNYGEKNYNFIFITDHKHMIKVKKILKEIGLLTL